MAPAIRGRPGGNGPPKAPMDSPRLTESDHPALHYQGMLADAQRMHRYREAIAATVRPGDVVADLGTGTGVLALLAARAGARRVYAIDNRPQVIPLAARIVAANGAAGCITVLLGDAREVRVDEPVDVIINELIGDFGTDENIHECVAAFAREHLRPGGRILPERLQTWLVPVEYGDEFRGVFRADFHGLDLRPAVDLPFAPQAVMHRLRHRPRELAAAWRVEDIQFSREMGARRLPFAGQFRIAAAGALQGFVGYFRATLAAGIGLDNYPGAAGHWENWNWPVTPPLAVAPGDCIDAVLHARENMIAAGWTLDWRRM